MSLWELLGRSGELLGSSLRALRASLGALLPLFLSSRCRDTPWEPLFSGFDGFTYTKPSISKSATRRFGADRAKIPNGFSPPNPPLGDKSPNTFEEFGRESAKGLQNKRFALKLKLQSLPVIRHGPIGARICPARNGFPPLPP